jgi:hypothetical protein
MESIKAIQAQNIYRVNPITLFRQPQQKDNNIFANVSGFSLNHPAAQDQFRANNLDLLA